MRNTIQLTVVAFIGLVLLGAIIGSAVVIGFSLSKMKNPFKDDSPRTEMAPPQLPEMPPAFQRKVPMARTLKDARANFPTTIISPKLENRGEKLVAIRDADVVAYESGSLQLKAYVSKSRPGRGRRPAVIWAHDGLDGAIGPEVWNVARIFHDEGFVLMCPSFRGENDNPGRFEMLYGEVDDLLAAIDYMATNRQDVDPNRIYVAGHGAGGTLVLLAAEMGTAKVRAFFAMGGLLSLQLIMDHMRGAAYENVAPPFNYRHPEENRIRSPAFFVSGIVKRTFYFQGGKNLIYNNQAAAQMVWDARTRHVPFEAFIGRDFDDLRVVLPFLETIADKITEDNATVWAETNIRFTAEKDLSRKVPQ